MAPKLYYNKLSAPSRSTLLTIKALDIEVELVELDLFKQEHLTPEFVKKNPIHTVPTLEEDHGFVLWDSHAINGYLVDKYGGLDDSLYPKHPELRATINQRLHFDSGVLSSNLKIILSSIMREGAKIVSKEKSDAVVQGYTLLETLLEKSKYVAGPHITIADFSTVTTISVANVLVPLASNRFPQILDWLDRMQKLPYYASAAQEGLNGTITLIKNKMANK